MTDTVAWWNVLAVCSLLSPAVAAESKDGLLTVHLAQANNNSPYAFVRAKFEPGEISDPWAVRFFDKEGKEIPYFVWDSVTWEVAREGRADWGHRYALLNHAPGCAPEVLAARGRKLQWAKENLPELGAKLEAQDEAAKHAGQSVCAALYLLRHRAPAYAKQRLTLRVYPSRQVEPRRQQWKGQKVDRQVSVLQGDLGFRDLPDRLAVTWRGKRLFRYAGFDAGDTTGTASHADRARPFSIEAAEGIITKLSIASETQGRNSSPMDWQCTYWLFPEGSYVALEGFSVFNTEGYRGGEQKLTVWQSDGEFTPIHEPLWTAPWWVHRIGELGFVATHLWHDVPLTIGYGNNPLTVNAEAAGQAPQVQGEGHRLALRWHYALDDPAVRRVFAPDENVRWEPKVDWLYRQYAVGLGRTQPEAETALRGLIGAAAGWIDRPVEEEKMAALMVDILSRMEARSAVSWDLPLWIAPAVLNPDEVAMEEVLRSQRRRPNVGSPGRTEDYIQKLRANVARGGNPLHARNPQLAAKGIPCEGWFDNPAYHAAKLPAYVRFLGHFDLPRTEQEDRESVLRYADYSLEHMGGSPPDLEKLRSAWRSFWPNRTVMLIPLVLHAQTLTDDPKYGRVAAAMFDDLLAMVQTNPHGYWNAWTFQPQNAQLFDSVYNPVGYLRGVTILWADGYLDLIGREKASRFTAAQARYLVFSGQLLDTFEVDRPTAICARTHHGHPNFRNQVSQFFYDDFQFYRGLFCDIIHWAAADPIHGRGGGFVSGNSPYRTIALDYDAAPLLRWALGIGRNTRWFEHTIDPRPEGFTLRLRNSSPWKQPTLALTARQLGLSRQDKEALWLQMLEPAYRRLAELDVIKDGEAVRVRISHHMKLRLDYASLRPDWSDSSRLALVLRGDGTEKAAKPLRWAATTVEWEARPGEYLLKPVR